MKVMMVYMTAKNRKEALVIGEALIKKKLTACVNVLGPIDSIYRWEGKINRDREVAFLAKTRASLVPRLIHEVRRLHSYKCPCIIAWSIEKGNPDFLKWVGDSTE